MQDSGPRGPGLETPGLDIKILKVSLKECVRHAAQTALHSVCQLQPQYVVQLVSCRPVWMTAVSLPRSASVRITRRPSPFRQLIYHLLYMVIAIPC